jgi:SNF2 family DNA or RNA helicase
MTNAGQTKFPTPFAAFLETWRLESFEDDVSLLPAFSSSSIKILPYQIAAAQFAMRSQYLKGCILCDEGSLGKTYEALLIIAQKWYEGKEDILVVLPRNLIPQWQKKLQESFTLPTVRWNTLFAA